MKINNFYFRYIRYISDTSISSFSGIKIQISIFVVYTEACSIHAIQMFDFILYSISFNIISSPDLSASVLQVPEEKFFDSEAATVKKRPSSPKTREPPVRFVIVYYIKYEKKNTLNSSGSWE